MGSMVCTLIALLVAGYAAAPEEQPVRWSLAQKAGTAAVAAGRTVELQLTASIDPGWHVYGLTQAPRGPKPLVIRLPDGQPFTLGGAIVAPEPTRGFDETFEIETEFYEERAVFRVPVAVMAAAPAGSQRVAVSVRYQSCGEEICRQAVTETVTLNVSVQASRGSRR